jgi:hypothetical protein
LSHYDKRIRRTQPKSERIRLGFGARLKEPEEEMLLISDVEVARVLDDIGVAEGRLLLVESELVLREARVRNVEDCRR